MGISVLVVNSMFDKQKLLGRIEECEFGLDDMISFILLWGLVNAYYGNWVPSVMAGLLAIGLWWVGRIDIRNILSKND